MKDFYKFLSDLKKVVLILLLSSGCFAHYASAQKNDTIFLLNGDKITGEIKSLQQGLLKLSTDAMKTVSIEYDRINTVFSSKSFEFIDKNRKYYFGSIVKSDHEATIGIAVLNDTIAFFIPEIVEINPIKSRFWNRFYGSIDAGGSYNQSTDLLQFTVTSSINYRAPKFTIGFSSNTIFSEQKTDDEKTIALKNDYGITYNQLLSGRWWGLSVLRYQKNTELNLKYRYQGGLGAAYDFVHTNPVRFLGGAGVVANSELGTDQTDPSTSLESILTVRFYWIKYRSPKVNISTEFDFIPSLTISGRYRIDADISVKYEIINDVNIGFTLYESYDRKPTDGGPALNDWGVSLTLGWTFP